MQPMAEQCLLAVHFANFVRALAILLLSCLQTSRWRVQCSASAASGAVPGDGSSSSSNSGAAAQPVVFSLLEQKIGAVCKTLTTLFPLWVILAATLGFYHPPLFTWFTDQAVTWSLMFCMLAMVRGLWAAATAAVYHIATVVRSMFASEPICIMLGLGE